jgi:SlyX protein
MSDSHEALQERIMELEIKASYTEDLLEQLNMTIYRQQQQIDLLINEVRELKRQAPEGGGGGAQSARRIAAALLTAAAPGISA